MENSLNLISNILSNPSHIKAYRNLANLYKKEGRANEYSALITLIEKRLKKNDNNTDNN